MTRKLLPPMERIGRKIQERIEQGGRGFLKKIAADKKHAGARSRNVILYQRFLEEMYL